MKIIRLAIVGIFASLLGFSCNSQDGPGSRTDDFHSSETYKIGELTADQYYAQYTYKALGDCQDPMTVAWRYFGNADPFGPLKVGKDAQGREKVASISLTMLTDGTYHGTYKEAAIISQDNTSITSEDLPEETRQLKGTWKVSKSSLVVSGLGTGVAWSMNGDPLVSFKVGRIEELPHLGGKTVDMGVVRTNSSDSGQSINQFCGFSR